MKATIETWHRFRQLSAQSQRIAVKAAVALAATWIGLRVAGYRRWRRLLDSRASARQASEAGTAARESALAVARLEASAARHLLLRTNCLEQSLVLWWLLRRRGIAAELRIGARKEHGQFEAHAWVELEGVVLNDAQGQHLHFAPFDGALGPMGIETP